MKLLLVEPSSGRLIARPNRKLPTLRLTLPYVAALLHPTSTSSMRQSTFFCRTRLATSTPTSCLPRLERHYISDCSRRVDWLIPMSGLPERRRFLECSSKYKIRYR